MFAQAELGRAVVALVALLPVQVPEGADAPGWHLCEGPGHAARRVLPVAEGDVAPGARLEAGVERTDPEAEAAEGAPAVAARLSLEVRDVAGARLDVELRAGVALHAEDGLLLQAGLGASLRF